MCICSKLNPTALFESGLVIISTTANFCGMSAMTNWYPIHITNLLTGNDNPKLKPWLQPFAYWVATPTKTWPTKTSRNAPKLLRTMNVGRQIFLIELAGTKILNRTDLPFAPTAAPLTLTYAPPNASTARLLKVQNFVGHYAFPEV